MRPQRPPPGSAPEDDDSLNCRQITSVGPVSTIMLNKSNWLNTSMVIPIIPIITKYTHSTVLLTSVATLNLCHDVIPQIWHSFHLLNFSPLKYLNNRHHVPELNRNKLQALNVVDSLKVGGAVTRYWCHKTVLLWLVVWQQRITLNEGFIYIVSGTCRQMYGRGNL